MWPKGNPDAGIRNPESLALESVIELKETGFHFPPPRDPDSSTWSPESRALNPEC